MSFEESENKAKEAVLHRQAAYKRLLGTKEPDASTILVDLAKFCRAHESTFNADARLHAVAEGRREVWLRIEQHLELTGEELWDLYPKRKG